MHTPIHKREFNFITPNPVLVKEPYGLNNKF